MHLVQVHALRVFVCAAAAAGGQAFNPYAKMGADNLYAASMALVSRETAPGVGLGVRPTCPDCSVNCRRCLLALSAQLTPADQAPWC